MLQARTNLDRSLASVFDDEVSDLRLLHEISMQLVHEENNTALYQKIIHAAMIIMRADFASMQMLHPTRGKHGELELLTHHGFSKEAADFWQWIGIDSKGSTCGKALREYQRIIVPDIAATNYMQGTHDLELFLKNGIRACQTTPLLARSGALTGMLSTHWRKPHTPSSRDFHMLDILCRQAADLIDRNRTLDALKQSEALNRQIIESSQDCIKIVDMNGMLVSMNQGGCNAMEIDDVTRYVGQKYVGFWNEQTQPAVMEAITTAMHGGTGQFEGYCPTLKTQTPKWWSVLITPMRDSTGTVHQLLAISRDITTAKEYERTLKKNTNSAEKATRAKSDYVAMMSHEIRTPMNAIVGLANILSRTPLSEQQRDFVDTLRGSAAHMLCLLNDMLDIEKIGQNSIKLEEVPFNITELLSGVRCLMEATAKEKGLYLTLEQGGLSHTQYSGDPARIRQIMINLCSNAIKFTQSGGITILAEDQGEALRLRVRDTGIGIETDKIHIIFEQFVQADPSINRQYGGSGLGLSITKQLVQLMDGTIHVTSTPGAGSEFCIILPLARA